ncbi:MAG: hypothetical protein COT91_00695 [Candidatus Doudnabacteria bacterium CG10_big_fil_rev_8_21_14_0_10_41_10]|uniref:Lysylphosphatidylglycerol synthetase family protein n=1 Tax=Candidatus Doudnabacteria bacterium CG10_big_fil_rev_8_21_14_0_10_41_10 TaxID=1974551 RepID=A0A2H0VH09_9BACT|nr:MAG: hypothetical protein COT91_00695 [Candidatus Doudnabacteria bacterium CG10_big_fil_rev_8_21_14_0_10_41_10]
MKKVNWQKTVGYLIPIVIFYFLFRSIGENFSLISDYDFDFKIFHLILSVIFVFFNSVLAAVILKYFFKHFGFYLSFLDMLRVYSLSQLAKYIPGGVWLYLLRFRFLNKRVSKESFIAVSALENIVYVLSGLILAFFVSLRIFTTIPQRAAALAMCLVILIFLFRVKWFYFFVDKAMKFFKSSGELNYQRIGRGPLFITLFGSTLNWILVGIGFFFFVSSFLQVNYGMLPWFVAVFAASVTAGYIFIIAPGGLGVREGIMVLLLQSVFGLEVATVIAVATRLWAVVSESFIAGLITLFSKNNLK